MRGYPYLWALLSRQLKLVNTPKLNQGGNNPILEQSLPHYFRQYVGFLDKDGNRLVHINFYWDEYSVADKLKGYSDQQLTYDSPYSLVLLASQRQSDHQTHQRFAGQRRRVIFTGSTALPGRSRKNSSGKIMGQPASTNLVLILSTYKSFPLEESLSSLLSSVKCLLLVD
jgi:hypothetical protein